MARPGPSLAGAFDLLGAAGQDKLLYLKHKLKASRPGCRGADLLRAMVLLRLGQETEARIALEAMKGDAVAQLVARRWAGVDGAEAPEDPPDLSWAVARLYHLLSEEELCPEPLRDVAYRAALHAFTSRADHRLGELQDEARDRCGWDITGAPGDFAPLHSDLGCLPPSSASPSRTRSLPQPIESLSAWSRGCSLRSTGSPASLASDLEISQSPTLRVLSGHRGPHGPSKLCEEPRASPAPEPAPVGCQEPEEMSWPPSGDSGSPPVLPRDPGPEVAPDAPAGLADPPEALETSTHYPVECTEVSAAPPSLPSPSVKDQTPPQLPAEDTPSPPAQPCPPTPSGPTTSPPGPAPCTPRLAHPAPVPLGATPPETESSEQKFYNFVVLHAGADELIALRVRERLEALGVPDGATFCEDFQVPGRGALRCLQDAIDHSAFTILLLTANFDCRLSVHQVSQALMSSLTRHGWQDCVIPFLPLESSPAQLSPDTAGLLTGLVWLDEHSRIFPRKVASTFRAQQLRARRASWRKEQGARALRAQSQHLEGERRQGAAWSAAYSAYLQSYLAWQAQMGQLQAAFGSHLSLGTQGPYGGQVPLGGQPPFPTWPGLQPPAVPPWLAGTPPPAFSQPPAFQQPPTLPQAPAFPQPPTFSQPPTFPQAPPATPQSPGLQPLIIHHAQMVQLGLNNHMWNQRGAQAPEDQPQEGE
ncbi:PREDICTED: TIR domain-containing adapter molecule 1 [Ceratotherium simum simum]|uniref:TIR domain-containing adapter molecule 1 n=1 Tax=Ceratotherium simum simum TaxID=73337 RepID=A0ABM0I6J6_CERSS|nr:PREDICTED: TIR domain-containing adapter molecule 1 [Ceratotherium simum simum]